jgi:hypothetical protein
MSSVILTNWTVYYASDAGAGKGYKQIKWTGTTGTNTVNELYSALMHLFDNASQNVAATSIPLKALTPTLYEIGSFDAGDRRPWFIDPTSVKHLTGGGLNSKSWARDTTARTASHGIVKITRTGTNIVAGDIGATINNATGGDDGWLLHVDGNTLWICPDTSASGDDWDSATGNITCNSHTDVQASAAVTAESIWSNIYTLGTIESQTEMLVYQNSAPLTQWWSTGHIDILVLVKDFGTLTDSGILVIYARQYSKLYDHYQVTVATGGRTPIPLSTSTDTNNATGYSTFTGTGGSSALFNAGNYMYVGASWAAATAKAVVTAVNSSTLTYYLIGDLTPISSGNTVTEYVPATGANGDGSCTAGTVTAAANGPTDTDPATITTTFSGTSQNLLNGNGLRPYSVIVDCQQVALTIVYQRLKYITRRGETGDIDAGSQTITGQSYTGIGDYYIPYDNGSIDNPFTEGETITAAGGFSCTLTSKHDRGSSEGFIIVRNVRGTVPVDNTTLTGATHTALVDTNAGLDPVTAITLFKQSPFGTFAGGKFFGARGVWLTDYKSADANAYELIDSEGVRQAPPQTIAITIGGVESGDRVSVFQTTGDNETINQAMFTSHAGNNTVGLNTFEVAASTPIPTDTPASGTIRVVDNSLNRETRYAYTSWSGFIFSGLTPSLTTTYEGTDTAYVPYVDEQAAGTSVSKSLTYYANRYVLTVVRITGIQPFKVKGEIKTTGLSVTAIRNPDMVYTA